LVRFEVLIEVVIKSSIFWDITLCGPLKVNRRFGGNVASVFGALFDLFFNPENSYAFLRNVG
jgi:hypothetical protein